jgi:hypothetical protein
MCAPHMQMPSEGDTVGNTEQAPSRRVRIVLCAAVVAIAAIVPGTGLAASWTSGLAKPSASWTSGIAKPSASWTSGLANPSASWTSGLARPSASWTSGLVKPSASWTSGVAKPGASWTSGARASQLR